MYKKYGVDINGSHRATQGEKKVWGHVEMREPHVAAIK